MDAESKRLDRTRYRLSDRLTIEIWTSDRGIEVEWEPDIPRQMTEQESEGYQKAMAQFLSRLCFDAGRIQ